MPVITLRRDRLESLVGGDLGFKVLVDRLPHLGLHLEEVSEDSVKVEYDPNRLDYSTDYGVARSLRGSFGLAKGMPRHRLSKSGIVFAVDPSVKKVRPYIAGLQAEGIRLDDETIRQIISMQEDLHNGLGRKRAKLAIGIHDADAVRAPLKYSTVSSSFRFIPLDSKVPLSIREILTKLSTGRKYAPLVSAHKIYPIITDAKGTVLSFPPVINGNMTKVTPRTRNLLIDVTGTDRRVLEDCLAILAEAFWDAGARVSSVEVKDGRSTTFTPSLEPFSFVATNQLISDRLGLKLSDQEIVKAFKKSRLDASTNGKRIAVTAPRYRFDLLHSVDLVEEAMYGYGFEKLLPSYDFKYTKGSLSPRTHLMEAVRRSAVGLGLQEVMGYSLTSGDVLYEKMERKRDTPLKVAASKSSLYEYLRDMVAPTLLQLLADNIHEPYPQRIFEMAEVFSSARGTETGVKEELRFAAAITNNTASFTDAKSVIDTVLLRTFNVKLAYRPTQAPFLIDGRAAECLYRGVKLGITGEVSPRVLISFGLRTPVAILEVSLDPFLRKVSS